MNIVKLDRKKVLVHPSQAESIKDKGVVIGEKLPSRMMMVNDKRMRGQHQEHDVGRPVTTVNNSLKIQHGGHLRYQLNSHKHLRCHPS
jgi:hypothetical protein